MRLVDLNPTWRHWYQATSREKAIGCSFDCPVHGKAHRVDVDFANTFDGAAAVTRQNLWTRTGDTFETLTITPSVDYTKYDNGAIRDASCWHGFVTNGQIT